MNYSISFYLGYFLPMIIFSFIAIFLAKKLYAWVIFAVGAIIQLISIVGNQNKLANTDHLFLTDEAISQIMSRFWVMYFVILLISVCLIVLIYKRTHSEENNAQLKEIFINCEKCETSFNKKETHCPKCGNRNIYR